MEHVDPSKIRFSIPTLEDALPAMRAGDEHVLRIHEDDWRQMELVASRFRSDIDQELDAIRQVRSEARGVGFLRCHVRSRIPAPLAGVELTSAEVTRVFGHPRVQAFSCGAPGSVVVGGFAFSAGDAVVYGHEAAGAVRALGFAHAEIGDAAPLAAIAAEKSLVLVDWCRCAVHAPGPDGFTR